MKYGYDENGPLPGTPVARNDSPESLGVKGGSSHASKGHGGNGGGRSKSSSYFSRLNPFGSKLKAPAQVEAPVTALADEASVGPAAGPDTDAGEKTRELENLRTRERFAAGLKNDNKGIEKAEEMKGGRVGGRVNLSCVTDNSIITRSL